MGLAVALEFTFGVAAAGATTLVMPDRDALKGTAVVFWGNTTLANGTASSLDCGDGSPVVAGPVADQSYIATTCTYAAAGTFNAKLTVGAESATAKVTVRDPAALSAFDLRATKVNMAIEDGLRFLYFSQFNRATTFTTNQTSWGGAGASNYINRSTAMAILSIQNHGHQINAPATDIFQPVVQRGLNWLFDKMVTRDLTPCNEGGGDPCVAVPAPVNTGLSAPTDGDDGYATPIFAAAIAAATAVTPAATVAAGLGGSQVPPNFVAGKPYSEILQRLVNAISWGQTDGASGGGWYYNLQPGFDASDGSTMGWAMLGLENSQAAGATIPAFVKTRFATVLGNQLNNNGGLDYQVNSNPNGTSNEAKTGIGLQGLAFIGTAISDPKVTAATGYLVRNWTATVPADFDGFSCTVGTPSTTNKGCGYAMFNVFKGLRLYGIQTLAGIGRPAGPGPIPADDWYADYVDNLLANQNNPTDPTHGEWSTSSPNPMGWSCCDSDTTGITAMAELILAPTAFVAAGSVSLAPAAANNPVGTSHTVTATALTPAGAPAPGSTVTFTILTGPNAGPAVCAESGGNTNTTDANGQAKCTYTDTKGAGTDTIQASIGVIVSNVVSKTWGGVGPPPVVTNIPTLSEWAQIVMAALLLLIGVWALRRRKG